MCQKFTADGHISKYNLPLLGFEFDGWLFTKAVPWSNESAVGWVSACDLWLDLAVGGGGTVIEWENAVVKMLN